ncbi:MAG TPA: FTR1 family protein [Gemmatimonadaceae bacterium]
MCTLTAALPAIAQERPAKRVANIVGVAVEEYRKGVDESGRITLQMEYDEAVTFLADAREAAARLSGDGADSARLALDSLSALVERRAPPNALEPWLKHFMQSLGADAALDLPTQPIDLAAGERLYGQHCAACHGPRGLGDGPAAAGMNPPPPAIGRAEDVADISPALMFRIVSVGIAGTPMAAFSGTLSVDERWSVIAYVNTLRAPTALAEGQGAYVQKCASCHGPTGGSNGTLTSALAKVPVELSSFAWQAERSDVQIAEVIKEGVDGTAMPPSRDLTDEELATLVAYVRTLSHNDAPGAMLAGSGSTDPRERVRAVMRLLDEGLAAARAGRSEEAADRGFDAYIAFEPIETPARARAPGLVATLERHFADFRGALRAGDIRGAERARAAIEQGMPGIVSAASTSGGGLGAFLQSLLIILREGFEAILVIGAIVAFLIKTGHRERLRSIWIGVGAALGASAVTAVVLATALRALPATREVIEGVTMLVAVAVLFSVSYWLISKVEAAKWQQFIREKVDAALQHGGGTALAFVAFLAVYREGAETALFYQALLHEGNGTVIPIVAGLVVGGIALAVIYTLFHRYGVRMPLRPFFGVTSVLLYYMAFVFMGKGIRELQEGNVLSITVLPGWPHVDAMGVFPSAETMLAQGVLLALFLFAVVKTFWPKRAVVLPTVPDAPSPEAQAIESTLERVVERLAHIEERVERIEQAVSGAEHTAERNTPTSVMR